MPDGANSRRRFLQTTAATTAAVATLNAAQAAQRNPERLGEVQRSTVATMHPVDAAPLPTVRFGKYDVSRLIIGTNPFFGYSHFNGVLDRFMREYYTEDKRAEVLHQCERAGIRTWQLHYHSDTITLLKRIRSEGSRMNMFLLSDFEMHKDFSMIPGLAKLGFIGMAHHGNRTDDAFRAKDMSRVHEFVKRVKDTGTLAGVSMHNPDVLDYIESKGWDVDYYQTCFYHVSRNAAEARELMNGERPLGETFLEKDPERMSAMMRKTKRPCLGFKILAAGRSGWTTEQIEAAFKRAFTSIKSSDAVIVGMCPKFKDEVTENAGIVRKLLG